MPLKAWFQVGNTRATHLRDLKDGKLHIELAGAEFASGDWTISLIELDETLVREKLKIDAAEKAGGSDDLLATWEGPLSPVVVKAKTTYLPSPGGYRRSPAVPEQPVRIQVGFAGDPMSTTYNVYLQEFQQEMDIHELGIVVHPKGDPGAKQELIGALTIDATDQALDDQTEAVLADVAARRAALQQRWVAIMARVAEVTGYDMATAEGTLLNRITRDRVRIVLEADLILGGRSEPETIFSLWHKEGSSKLPSTTGGFSGYATSDQARYVGRAYAYWIATGNDHFHAKSGATAQERKQNDNEPSDDPKEHKKVFSASAKPLIKRKWIPADIEQRVHATSLTTQKVAGDWAAQPTGKFDLYAVLLMSAEFLRRQKDAGDRVSPPQAELSVLQARIAYVVGEGKSGGTKGLAGMWGSATEHRDRYVLLEAVQQLKEAWAELLDSKPDPADAAAWSAWVTRAQDYLDRLARERDRIDREGQAKVTGKFVGKSNAWRPKREWKWVDQPKLSDYAERDEAAPGGMLTATRQDDPTVKAAWKRWGAFSAKTKKGGKRFEHPTLGVRLFHHPEISAQGQPTVEEFVRWSEVSGWYWSSWQTSRKGVLKMMAMREIFADAFAALP